LEARRVGVLGRISTRPSPGGRTRRDRFRQKTNARSNPCLPSGP
jgi:hypothetical protein